MASLLLTAVCVQVLLQVVQAKESQNTFRIGTETGYFLFEIEKKKCELNAV